MKDKNIQKVMDIINSRKKQTNCFIYYTDIKKTLIDGDAKSYIINDELFIFHRVNSFYKLYYFVDNLENIAYANELFYNFEKDSTLALDFTTKKGKNLEQLSTILTSLNFSFYSEYARVISGSSAFTVDEKDREKEKVYYDLANLSDINELLNIINSEFDPITDNLPNKQELANLINSKSIIIKRIDNKIVLIQVYEYSKNTLYSRMTWVDKKYRKPKYTIDFYTGLDEYLKSLNIKDWEKIRSYGWINKKNKNYKINLKFGAKTDDVTCTTFIYKHSKEKTNEN